LSRVCCNNESEYEVIYDGGVMGNDKILVCSVHITKHPFDKKIISKTRIDQYQEIKKIQVHSKLKLVEGQGGLKLL